MSDLTRYRRLPGYSTVGTDNTLPPGSYSSAVADWVPDTTLADIADVWDEWKMHGTSHEKFAMAVDGILMEGTDDE